MLKLVVFVPGFMCSSLVYHGISPARQRIEVPAWGQDLAQTSRNVKYLAYPAQPPASIEVKSIIDHVTFGDLPFFGDDVYGVLLRHLRAFTRNNRIEFLEFPYDWRASIR